MDKDVFTVPNWFSYFRMAAVPALLFLAWLEQPTAFLVLLVCSFLSDLVDGWIARRFNQATDFGARLDSSADNMTALALPLCAWWLWPDILMREMPYVITVLVIYLVTVAVSVARFGSLPAYHTLSAKIAAVLMSISVCLLFVFDKNQLFHIATWFQVWVGFESVVISLLLPEKAANILTFVHAWRIRKKQKQ